MNFGKFLVMLGLGVVGLFLAFKLIGLLLGWALHAIFAIAIPVALLVGVAYLIYRVAGRKALGSRKRGILP